MSQMFIGIIGIVVVIGLAIAGAVYFGDQFQQSRSKSRAAAAVAATSQVANAAQVFLAQEGGVVAAASDVTAQLITPGYLSSLPTNPMVPANVPRLMTGGGLLTGGADAAVIDLGAGAEVVCRQIGIQTGQLASNATASATSVNIPNNISGCFRALAGGGAGLTTGNHYAYTRI